MLKIPGMAGREPTATMQFSNANGDVDPSECVSLSDWGPSEFSPRLHQRHTPRLAQLPDAAGQFADHVAFEVSQAIEIDLGFGER